MGDTAENGLVGTESYVLLPVIGTDEVVAVFSDGSYARWTPLETID